VVAFNYLGETISKNPAPSDGVLLDALRNVAPYSVRVAFHPEKDAGLQHGIARDNVSGRTDHLVGSRQTRCSVMLCRSGVLRRQRHRYRARDCRA
jgi:hypothetical protein